MPLAAITGDVHHYLGNHPLEKKEYLFAKKYLEIIEEYDAKATLFITGKCIEENKDYWKSISKDYPVEFGGHSYYALQPAKLFTAFNTLFSRFGLRYGPPQYQLVDISLTNKIYKEIDIDLNCWRTHAYRSDRLTPKFLRDFGISILSEIPSREAKNMTNVHINTYPDDKVFTSLYSSEKIDMEGEMEKVKKSIAQKIKNKQDIVAQLHPASMKVYDDFEYFEELIERLKDNAYSFKTISGYAEEMR